MADKPDKVADVEQCSTCRWWRPKTGRDKTAECHRYAPTPDGSEESKREVETDFRDNGLR